MALLRLLTDLTTGQHWPLQLVVAHCDHNMRPDSSANAAFVRRQAEQLGLEYHQRVAEQQLKGEVGRAVGWAMSACQCCSSTAWV